MLANRNMFNETGKSETVYDTIMVVNIFFVQLHWRSSRRALLAGFV